MPESDPTIRCPYCVEGSDFKVMLPIAGGDWHRCEGCGHVVFQNDLAFKCACLNCADFGPLRVFSVANFQPAACSAGTDQTFASRLFRRNHFDKRVKTALLHGFQCGRNTRVVHCGLAELTRAAAFDQSEVGSAGLRH